MASGTSSEVYETSGTGDDRLAHVPAHESNYDHLAGSAPASSSADAGWCTMIGLQVCILLDLLMRHKLGRHGSACGGKAHGHNPKWADTTTF